MAKKKYIESPEKMWELFLAYKKKTKSKPRYDNVLNGKTSEIIPIPRETCLTMEGFENYCEEVIGHVHQYFANQDNLYGDYMSICSRIRRHIRQDQIEGGMAGIYNASITQRLNGLVDKKDVDIKKKEDYSELDEDELIERIKKELEGSEKNTAT